MKIPFYLMESEVVYVSVGTNNQYQRDLDKNLLYYNGKDWVLSCIRYNDLNLMRFIEL